MRLRDLHRTVKIRLVEQLFNAMVSNMIFPFLLLYFSQQFGAKWTGVLYLSTVMVGLISNLYGGACSDRYGRRRVMIWSESIRLGAYSLMLVAISPWIDNPILVFVGALVSNACGGFSRPAGDAMIVDVSTPEDRKLIYSLDYAFWNGALFIGGIIGGFFFEEHRFEMIACLTVMSLISLLLLVYFIEETHVPSKSLAPMPKMLRQLVLNVKVVRHDTLFRFFFFASLFELSVQMIGLNYSGVRFVEEIHDTVLLHWNSFTYTVDGYKMFGLLNTGNTVLVLAFGTIVTMLTRRFSDRGVLTWGILIYTIGFAIICTSNQPWVLLVAMAIVVFGELAYVPVKQSLLASIIPSENRGAYMGVNSLVTRGATGIGYLGVTIGAFLAPVAVAVFLMVIGLIGIYLYRKVTTGKSQDLDEQNIGIVEAN